MQPGPTLKLFNSELEGQKRKPKRNFRWCHRKTKDRAIVRVQKESFQEMMVKAAMSPNKRSQELGMMVQAWWHTPVAPELWSGFGSMVSVLPVTALTWMYVPHQGPLPPNLSGEPGVREMNVFPAYLLLIFLPMIKIPTPPASSGPTCSSVNFLFHACLTSPPNMLRLSGSHPSLGPPEVIPPLVLLLSRRLSSTPLSPAWQKPGCSGCLLSHIGQGTNREKMPAQEPAGQPYLAADRMTA